MSRLLSLLALALVACETPAKVYKPVHEDSVRPGINDSYLREDLDVEAFVQRFEGESREIFLARTNIVAAMALEPGMDVADIGAGTGPFLALFSREVGRSGSVVAVDIAQGFVDHMNARIAAEGLANARAQLCRENSVDLPPHSIDVAFVCDVYHHFEYPRNSMASIALALRPGGQVVIADFERIPGVSSEWVLGHVRAGKQQVIAELDSYGFDLVEELEVEGLQENWLARFRKR